MSNSLFCVPKHCVAFLLHIVVICLLPAFPHLTAGQVLPAQGMKLNHEVANYNTRDDLGDLPSAPTTHIYQMTPGATPLLFHLEIQIAGSNLLDLSFSPYVQHLRVN